MVGDCHNRAVPLELPILNKDVYMDRDRLKEIKTANKYIHPSFANGIVLIEKIN